MPLDAPPPRDSRFGSPLTLSRVHWVRPELVAEVKFLSWTEDNLLRQVVYEGLREDKPAAEVRRATPYPKPAGSRARLPGNGLGPGNRLRRKAVRLFQGGTAIVPSGEPVATRPRPNFPPGPYLSHHQRWNRHHAPAMHFSPFLLI